MENIEFNITEVELVINFIDRKISKCSNRLHMLTNRHINNNLTEGELNQRKQSNECKELEENLEKWRGKRAELEKKQIEFINKKFSLEL